MLTSSKEKRSQNLPPPQNYPSISKTHWKYTDRHLGWFLACELCDQELVTETPDGKRQVRHYVTERETYATLDLPPNNLLRYAIKMATGSGKTIVMGLLIVWSYFNRKIENKTYLAHNFLMIAPNVIVLERLERDFREGTIFTHFPIVPPYLKNQWDIKVITRGDSSVPNPSGNLFLQNIQQLYEL